MTSFAVVLVGSKPMDHLYGSRRNFVSFLLTGHALVLNTNYVLSVIIKALHDYCFYLS